MNNQFDVIGLGNSIVDIQSKVNNELIKNLGFAKGSMSLVDLNQSMKIRQSLNHKSQTSGGSVANTAYNLQILGVKSAFGGVVADDDLGKLFIKDLEDNGVHAAVHVLANHNEHTGQCVIMVDEEGERTMATYLGINQYFTESTLPISAIESAKILYCEGYLFDNPAQKNAFYQASKIAKNIGNKVALSLSDAFCVGRHYDDFLHFCQNSVDILLANNAEITALTKQNSLADAIAKLAELCPQIQIYGITDGENGAHCKILDDTAFVPAQRVAVVDTTGAGDGFAAGFLCGLVRGESAFESGVLGVKVASEVIAHLGSRYRV